MIAGLQHKGQQFESGFYEIQVEQINTKSTPKKQDLQVPGRNHAATARRDAASELIIDKCRCQSVV